MDKNGLMDIIVAARSSPLSQAQVKEVEQLLTHQKLAFPFRFNPLFVQSTGDIDQKTSLRTLGKTDFFTKEIDHLLINGKCRIAIHSAKDLPEPLPAGLKIAALTHGLDPSDVLVLREGETLNSLSKNAVIATSSERRELAVRELRNDLTFIDIRGTIHQRLEKLHSGIADGVVIAEAALIRLNLTHLNRIQLPGETTTYQGQLAIVARADDFEMRDFFAALDSRPTLCLGLDIPKKFQNRMIDHKPIIKISPKSHDNFDIQEAFLQLRKFTHIIFTSKVGVKLFFQQFSNFGYHLKDLSHAKLISVGSATAKVISEQGANVHLISPEEHAEGLVEILKKEFKEEQNLFLFWPHSSLSREVLPNFFKQHNIRYAECLLYDTEENIQHQQVNFKDYGEVIFTSPSTVDAFFNIYTSLPENLWLTPIGPITFKHLQRS